MQKKVLSFKLEMVSNKYTTEQRLFSIFHKSQSQTELDRLKSPVDFQLMSFWDVASNASKIYGQTGRTKRDSHALHIPHL